MRNSRRHLCTGLGIIVAGLVLAVPAAHAEPADTYYAGQLKGKSQFKVLIHRKGDTLSRVILEAPARCRDSRKPGVERYKSRSELRGIAVKRGRFDARKTRKAGTGFKSVTKTSGRLGEDKGRIRFSSRTRNETGDIPEITGIEAGVEACRTRPQKAAIKQVSEQGFQRRLARPPFS